jgi:hypothetical protein
MPAMSADGKPRASGRLYRTGNEETTYSDLSTGYEQIFGAGSNLPVRPHAAPQVDHRARASQIASDLPDFAARLHRPANSLFRFGVGCRELRPGFSGEGHVHCIRCVSRTIGGDRNMLEHDDSVTLLSSVLFGRLRRKILRNNLRAGLISVDAFAARQNEAPAGRKE